MMAGDTHEIAAEFVKIYLANGGAEHASRAGKASNTAGELLDAARVGAWIGQLYASVLASVKTGDAGGGLPRG
jgi:hypothetical protein